MRDNEIGDGFVQWLVVRIPEGGEEFPQPTHLSHPPHEGPDLVLCGSPFRRHDVDGQQLPVLRMGEERTDKTVPVRVQWQLELCREFTDGFEISGVVVPLPANG